MKLINDHAIKYKSIWIALNLYFTLKNKINMYENFFCNLKRRKRQKYSISVFLRGSASKENKCINDVNQNIGTCMSRLPIPLPIFEIPLYFLSSAWKIGCINMELGNCQHW